MTANDAPRRHPSRKPRWCAVPAVVLAAAIVLPGPRAQTATPAPETPKRNIAGPGDYGLREKIVHQLGHDADLQKENYTLILVNGGAVFSGTMSNCALKKRALSIAALTRGVINVTDEMTVPRGNVPDDALAKAATSLLSDAAADLGLKSLDVHVADGVLTMNGVVKDVLARGNAEDIVGTVLGVTRVSNHLEPANAPSAQDDASLLNAEIAYLGDFHAFPYAAEMTVKVDQGVVTLRGKAALYMGRQQAAVVASLVKGVKSVDNRIKVDPSVLPRTRQIQAEK
jgi:osmotically-inducible protein OsmY